MSLNNKHRSLVNELQKKFSLTHEEAFKANIGTCINTTIRSNIEQINKMELPSCYLKLQSRNFLVSIGK